MAVRSTSARPAPARPAAIPSATVETGGDLGRLLGALLRAYLKGAAEAVAELPGGPRGYQVLSIAAGGGCRNQAEIAEVLGVDRTVMTYLLDDLEEARLIERRADPADRRSRQIVLTAKGRRQHGTLSARIAGVEGSLLADLTDAEAAQLRSLLARAAAVAGPGEPGELCALSDELGDELRADG